MDNRYLDIVLKEMSPFMTENGFKATEDGFVSDARAIKVLYSEDRQMFLLLTAEAVDGVMGEFLESSAWLFDDTQNARDAESVGIDFTNTVRDIIGVKAKRSAAAANVELPTSTNGNYNISAFAKKVLDVFPQFKDAYKAHVTVYGNFLYLNFFGETLVPQIKTVLTENNKKTVKKLYTMLSTGYVQGDRDTVNTIVACVSAACVDDETVKANAMAMLEGDPHFKNAVNEFIGVIASNKKLRASLIK